MKELTRFVRESNRVENIHREPAEGELEAHKKLLALKHPTVDDVTAFVQSVQPNAQIRDKDHLNVIVGDIYAPPRGGITIPLRLHDILQDIRLNNESPKTLHRRYEKLHPFTDGNGRSGRALWLWQMINCGYTDRPLELMKMGFLHMWYYQSLE